MSLVVIKYYVNPFPLLFTKKKLNAAYDDPPLPKWINQTYYLDQFMHACTYIYVYCSQIWNHKVHLLQRTVCVLYYQATTYQNPVAASVTLLWFCTLQTGRWTVGGWLTAWCRPASISLTRRRQLLAFL